MQFSIKIWSSYLLDNMELLSLPLAENKASFVYRGRPFFKDDLAGRESIDSLPAKSPFFVWLEDTQEPIVNKNLNSIVVSNNCDLLNYIHSP